MPKILITGNGFDLSLGLPTSYSDFINILNSLDNYGEINFDSVYSNCSNYEQITKKYNVFSIDCEKIEILKVEIQSNLWFQFFQNELEIETWIDFENKIEYVLNNLFTSVKYIKDNIFSKGSLSEEKINYKPLLFNNDVEILQVLNRFNIITLKENYDITLNVNYLIKKYDFFIDVDLNKITQKLIEELKDFKKIFNLYFEVFVYPFYDNQKTRVDRNLFLSITKHYTFNYTPTFEKIYKRVNKTSFLHGKIDSDSNEIVLGINEIPNDELDKRYFLPFTKYYQKLNNNTDFEFISDFEKKKNSNFQFFFFGHSLDTSDEDYINEVFDFVNGLKSKIKTILIIHHNKSSKSKLLINLLNIRGKDDIQALMRSKNLMFLNIDSTELRHELKKDISMSAGVSYNI
ncbi:AbiH family protein [Thalassobellus suaedae]|uniref:AbiH family protein n=1 Tax=Thalassobellus suaedae TaxID=3074124 RepID=A0ABY9Y2R3_9FLAO|nr:AbiH family protein [Flavobacteriaceae bacterium HL-DH10]